ncbi:YceI family protein [Gaoshiqia sediminis]|uniref:YceI family protein n=1 Tax=Gaoshiqia sediminis TaxID=2986998 RepID=A0AA41Y0P4_9BACT|nr:YceI family protein [Gaoshiqia sediminis]MCW0481304.1 YceI family protein [Gaoshiqia sediminis]
MIRNFKISALAILFIVVNYTAMAQIQYKLDSKSSTMLVKGTSTIHDWEMKVEEVGGSITLGEELNLDKLTGGNLSIHVNSIKSDQNLMNKKAYEALKEKDHPLIKVKILRVEPDQGKVQLELTIAGKTGNVNEDFQLANQSNGTIQVKGELDVKMSDYGVKPPVALMGTIKTGDDVKIAYDLIYHK